jgi:hypothetical protein
MTRLWMLAVLLIVAPSAEGCRQVQEPPQTKDSEQVPQSREMGGAKSVMTFFVTSKGLGKGGDLGGLSAPTHTARRLRKRKVRETTRGGRT